jgi:hypothetical protein
MPSFSCSSLIVGVMTRVCSLRAHAEAQQGDPEDPDTEYATQEALIMQKLFTTNQWQ